MEEKAKKRKKEVKEVENPQVLFSWKAPIRPYKKPSGKIMRFYIALVLLFSVFIFFFASKILLVPVWAAVFVFYILTTVPSGETENKITKFGVETGNTTFRWEWLSYFYFIKRFGYDVLTLVTHPPYNFHIYLVIPDEKTKKKVKLLLSEHIVYKEKPPRNLADRLVDLLSYLIPED